MIQFTNPIEIERPQAEVFAYISDLEHTPEWNWAISETRKSSPGPVGVGTTYKQTRTVPKVATEDLEITALEPDELLEVSGELASLPAHLSYRLHSSAHGTTIVNAIEIQPRGALRLLAPVAERRIQQAVAENLRALKAHLEGEPSQAPHRAMAPTGLRSLARERTASMCRLQPVTVRGGAAQGRKAR